MDDINEPMEAEGPEMDNPAEELQEKVMARGEPEVPEARKRLVAKWQSEIRADKKHWGPAFQQMREDQDFARGKQWGKDWKDDRYVANITLRHIQQRVASLYAKNPKAVARRKTRMMNTVWDGTLGSVMGAMQAMQQAGMMGDVMKMQENMQILQEAQQSVQTKKMLDDFGKTLELLYEYNLDEQHHPFKTMMKLVVRRAITTGVGYAKLGFQRILEPRPDVEAKIADATQKLATVERLTADIADGENTDEYSEDRETLRLQLQALQAEGQAVVREGLIVDYPDSTSIIPDRKTRQLREFLGSDYITQEYVLTPDEIKEIYGVDIGKEFKGYRPGTTEDPLVSPTTEAEYDAETGMWHYDDQGAQDKAKCVALVWETYDKKTGLVYTTCDGYKDFLREPGAPEIWMERFFPWFPLVLNECDHPARIYPPSDVFLIRDQQKEYNRLREGLREHRLANRPATVVSSGALSEKDADKMVNRPANALIELDGLQPGQSVDQLLQALKLPGVDQNLYEVNGIFEDILRTVGTQEATLGGMSGGTATESSIAESSRQSASESNVDDLDEMLTQMARAGGQILMAEVSEETVKEIVGPGAVWPELSREELAKEIHLEIEAGSTGKPNQAQEIQNYERLAPLLMQVPGVSPELLAKEGIRRLDDRLELQDIYDPAQISITAMNQIAGQPAQGGPGAQPGAEAQGPGASPGQQGPEGANNAPQPDAPAGASPEGTVPQQVM